MNIEELNLEYNNKVKELTKQEEPFIKKKQDYFVINDTFELDYYYYANDDYDKQYLECGNMFPFTEENKDEIYKEVLLIAEIRKLQSQMEMFARQNNEGKIDWRNYEQAKWFLYNDCGEITIDFTCRHRELNVVYFTSEEITKKALEKFGDRIRELYLQEGEEYKEDKE